MTASLLQRVPAEPAPDARYLFYLHGLIVEFGGRRPYSEEHGYYEYDQIVEALAADGTTVISEVRAEGTEVPAYAETITAQIRQLLDHGVPAQNIIVVGASKGGVIATHVAQAMQERELQFVVLAGLFEKYLDQEIKLYGRILSIHDRSDSFAMSPEAYFRRSEGQGEFTTLILGTGLGHGLVYQPYEHWLGPLRHWLGRSASQPS
jgi:acetyl esterase/lipase